METECIVIVDDDYRCPFCNKRFVCLRTLKRHISIHTRETQFKCDLCRRSFASARSLKCHIVIHTREKPHKCHFCNKAFATAGHLKRHKRSHTGKSGYKCELCSMMFCKSMELRQHKKIHTGDKQNMCELCSKWFFSSSELKGHERPKVGGKQFIDRVHEATVQIIHLDHNYAYAVGSGCCVLCHKELAPYSSLTDMIETCTSEKIYSGELSKNVQCSAQARIGKRTFECHNSSKAFFQNTNVKIHSDILGAEKPYRCKFCTETFSQISHLKEHGKIHTGIKCNLCNNTFSSSAKLCQHLTTHVLPYCCELCHKTFAAVSHLKAHILGLHQESYQNNLCTKAFADADHLKCHMRILTGEKPYRCKIYVAFTKAPHLGCHIETEIDDRMQMPFLVKPYGCGICDAVLEAEDEFLDHCCNHLESCVI